MLKRCTGEAQRLGRQLLFGMTMSLALQSVLIPDDCDLEADALHMVSSVKSLRVRSRNSVLPYLRKHVATAPRVNINGYILALDLFHVGPASHSSFIRVDGWRRHSRRSEQAAASVVRAGHGCGVSRFGAFRGEAPRSRAGAHACRHAVADSPKESELHLALLSHGIPCPVLNYMMPNMRFTSGDDDRGHGMARVQNRRRIRR